MGKKNYSGGGTILNGGLGFATYDPGEKQRRTILRSEPVYGPVRSSNAYTLQVQVQLSLLLRLIANGKKKPYVPLMFKEEISEFASLLEWAHSKPAFGVLLKERRDFSEKKSSAELKRSRKIRQAKKKKKGNKSKGKTPMSDPSVSMRDAKDAFVQQSQRTKVSKLAAAAKKLGISEVELIRRINTVRASSKT